ncbi:MAG: hypothetical protein HS126_09515 [Anaerolineales bacterium]|nr:hypothetical protein [Anaerolineales bacterium]
MDFDAQGSFFSLATSCLTQSPVLLVWVGGLFLALTRWEQHPRTSLFALIAIVLEVVALLSSLFFVTWLIPLLYQQGWEATNISMAVAGSTFFHAILSAVAWGLLIYAVFYGQDSAKSETRPAEE